MIPNVYSFFVSPMMVPGIPGPTYQVLPSWQYKIPIAIVVFIMIVACILGVIALIRRSKGASFWN